MRSTALSLVLSSMLLFLVLVPNAASADITTDLEAELEASGKLTAVGTTEVDGFEAKLVRLAIDSQVRIPDFGLLGTGNGDGVVNGSEANEYATEAIGTGLVSKAFDKGIIKVEEDGKDRPAKLRSLVIRDAEGNTTSDAPLNVTFEVEFDLDFDQDVDNHRILVKLTFNNVSYGIRFTLPKGWTIGEVSGLKDKKVVNKDEGAYVEGQGSGDGTPVVVEVKKEGELCCLLIFVGIVVIIVVVVILYQRHRRKKRLEQSLAQPEYETVSPEGAVLGFPKDGKGETPRPPKDPNAARRISKDTRSFGKDYFEDKDKDKRLVK